MSLTRILGILLIAGGALGLALGTFLLLGLKRE